MKEPKPTNTDIVIKRLREKGLKISRGTFENGAYRVQPKMTGCERRVALCEWSRWLQMYTDCYWKLGHREGRGVDFLSKLKDLATCDINDFLVKIEPHDAFLWVFVKDK